VKTVSDKVVMHSLA